MRFTFRAAVATVTTLIWSSSLAAPWGDRDGRWLDLWTRCRLAIEQGISVDSSGLKAAGEARFGRQGVTWNDPESIFEVEDSVADGGGRLCRVAIREGSWPEDIGDLVTIIGTFEDERRTLIAAGHHKWLPLDRVGDYAGAIAPLERSKDGCPIISGLIISLRDRSLISMTGEQVALPCAENQSAGDVPTP